MIHSDMFDILLTWRKHTKQEQELKLTTVQREGFNGRNENRKLTVVGVFVILEWTVYIYIVPLGLLSPSAHQITCQWLTVVVPLFPHKQSIRTSGLILLEAILCGALLLYFPVSLCSDIKQQPQFTRQKTLLEQLPLLQTHQTPWQPQLVALELIT